MSARRSSSVEVVASDPAPAEPASAAKRKSAAATDDAPAPAPKRARAAPKKKPEPEPSRWPWIDRARPEMEFKGTRVECYNCGGIFFKATGKGIADRLDKVEKFLAECEGDETRHPSYGSGMY